MQIPSELCGVDTIFAEWLAIAAYIALGAWLLLRWARHEEKPMPAWKFGDPSRRPGKSFEARILEHIGGVAVFISICVFGLRGLGIG